MPAAMIARTALIWLVVVSVAAAARADPSQDELLDTRPSTLPCDASAKRENAIYPFDVNAILAARIAGSPPGGKRKTANIVVVDSLFDDRGTAPFPTLLMHDHAATDDYAMPATAGIDALQIGHGTYVAGIVLGGRYDVDGDVDADNLATPSVRRLLFRPVPKPAEKVAPDADKDTSLRVWVMPMADNVQAFATNRVLQIDELIGDRDDNAGGVDIVNLSFLRYKTTTIDAPTGKLSKLPTRFPRVLFVAAAGNRGEELVEVSAQRYPVMSDDPGRNLLVVGSHNAGFYPSKFSNYGPKYVELAAPGCSIRSWLPGAKAPAEALKGTSMAAPVVTFAAGLLKSMWSDARPRDLHDRLLHSSSYHDELMNCEGRDANGESKPVECVRHGSALDIPMALLYTTDVLEYCQAPGVVPGKCPPLAVRRVLGELEGVPDWTTAERGATHDQASKFDLSLGSALRVGPGGQLQHLYIEVFPGSREQASARTFPMTSPGDLITFRAKGVQLDGEKVEGSDEDIFTIEMRQMIRIVKRSVPKRPGTPPPT